MIDFASKIKPTFIINDNGETYNIKDVPDKSINNIFTCKRILTENPIAWIQSDQARIISDQLLLQALVNYQGQLVSEWFHSNNKHWDITYSKGLAYYVESLFDRYQDLFKSFNVSTTYKYQPQFRQKIEANKKNASITINDTEYTTTKDILKYGALITKESDVRANSDGYHTLILAYTSEQFIQHLIYNIEQSHYGGESNFSWLLFEFIERFEKKVPHGVRLRDNYA